MLSRIDPRALLEQLVEGRNDLNDNSAKTPLTVELDWDAYYQRFKDVHGDPVIYKYTNGTSVLLFQDGWTYSERSKSGPEWSPPADPKELFILRSSYWHIREQMVTMERNILLGIITNLEAEARKHSLPLMQTLSHMNEAGKVERTATELDIEALRQGRLEWLEQDILDCQAQINELNNVKVVPFR